MAKWMVLICLSLAMFIIVIDTTIMNVSISALIIDLDTTVGGIQTAIALYAMTMASFILIGGKLADIIGKKRTFMIGVGIFGIGTAMASVSQSLGFLILGWSMIEGLGGALMMPNIQTILRDKYEGSERAFAYGIIGAVAAVGAAVGPIVGGFLTTYYTWRWAFVMEVFIVILVLVLCRFVAADKKQPETQKFDFVGAILSVFGWSTIVMGVLLGQSYGFWKAKQVFSIGGFEINPLGLSITPLLIGLGILLIFLLFEWEHDLEESGRPGLFKPSTLKSEGLKSGVAVRFCQMAITAAFLFTAPLLLQLSFEFSAMQTGKALIPFSLALLISAIVGARLSSRFTAKRIIQTGFILGILGLILVATTIVPDANPADLATGLLFGAGVGLIASQIMNLILSLAPEEDVAEVSGLNGTFEQLGNSIGVALVGTMMLGGLYSNLETRVMDYDAAPYELKFEVLEALQNSIQLVSDSQLKTELVAIGASDALIVGTVNIYAEARTNAFKVGIWFLVFIACIGLILTRRLPNRKMV